MSRWRSWGNIQPSGLLCVILLQALPDKPARALDGCCRSMSKKKRGKTVFNGMEEAGEFREQPQALGRRDSRCPVCGLPVDRQRIAAHMLRFHGGAEAVTALKAGTTGADER